MFLVFIVIHSLSLLLIVYDLVGAVVPSRLIFRPAYFLYCFYKFLFVFIWHFSYQAERGRSTLGRSCDCGERKLKFILLNKLNGTRTFLRQVRINRFIVYKYIQMHTNIPNIHMLQIYICLTSSSFHTYCSTSRSNYLIIKASLRKLPIRSRSDESSTLIH